MYKYRHYSAELGRWLSRDPIGEHGGPNLYAFVGNNSLNWWDKLGLYNIQPDKTNGPNASQLKKITDSIDRVKKRSQVLIRKLNKILDCIAYSFIDEKCITSHHPSVNSNATFAELVNMIKVFEGIVEGIDGSGNLEIELKDLGTVDDGSAQLERLGGAWDPVMALNTNTANHWETWSNAKLDTAIMHELSHISGGTLDPEHYPEDRPSWRITAYTIEELMKIDPCQSASVSAMLGSLYEKCCP